MKEHRHNIAAAITLLLLLLGTGGSAASDDSSDTIRDTLLISGLALTAYNRDTTGLKQYISTASTAAVITLALKKFIRSERPNGQDNDSFPSGHTTVAFASASFIHRRYGLPIGLPAYIGASAVAIDRVDKKHHRGTDVIAGAIIGILSSQWLVSAYPRSAPFISTDGEMISVQFQF